MFSIIEHSEMSKKSKTCVEICSQLYHIYVEEKHICDFSFLYYMLFLKMTFKVNECIDTCL